MKFLFMKIQKSYIHSIEMIPQKYRLLKCENLSLKKLIMKVIDDFKSKKNLH